jgi:hypothetical protein
MSENASEERVELARYEAADGMRVLVGQRIEDAVRLTDRHAESRGKTYVVEPGVRSRSELEGILRDYVEQARRYGDCPMRFVGKVELEEQDQ